MSNNEKVISEEVEIARCANDLKEQGGTYSHDGLVKIVNNGNVTRQIMDGIGMDSLLTYEENKPQEQAEDKVLQGE